MTNVDQSRPKPKAQLPQRAPAHPADDRISSELMILVDIDRMAL
jgi:hypothetical protein